MRKVFLEEHFHVSAVDGLWLGQRRRNKFLEDFFWSLCVSVPRR